MTGRKKNFPLERPDDLIADARPPTRAGAALGTALLKRNIFIYKPRRGEGAILLPFTERRSVIDIARQERETGDGPHRLGRLIVTESITRDALSLGTACQSDRQDKQGSPHD